MRIRAAAVLLLALSLAACSGAPEPSAAAPVEIAEAQAIAAESITPAVVDLRSLVEQIAPPPPPSTCQVAPDAVALIVRYEVTSPSYYTARLEAPIWPGAQSGVTWGVGYDGGHQTRLRILGDWQAHAAVDRLATTAGITGPPAKALLPALADVRTPYALASDVFAASTLPTYCDLTARTFRQGWHALPPLAQGALVATVYNRGAGMQGDRRREMRTLRDECVPAADVACMAAQFRSMPRLWVGTTVEAGLRARYEATARLLEQEPAS